MRAEQKIKILTWVVVTLGLLTLSMLSAFVYHIRIEEDEDVVQLEFYSVQMTGRNFMDVLNLTPDQRTIFRDINIDFRQAAKDINISLDQARSSMFAELKKSDPDMNRCSLLSAEIGKLHKDLKDITCEFYMETKEICTPSQIEKLEEMFIPIFTSTGGFGYGRGQGNGRGPGRFGRRWGQ